MKINWKVRFKNRTWVAAFVGCIITTIYQLMGMLEIAPAITQDEVVQIVTAVLQILTLTGVMIDPTTKGISDSERALGYEEPN